MTISSANTLSVLWLSLINLFYCFDSDTVVNSCWKWKVVHVDCVHVVEPWEYSTGSYVVERMKIKSESHSLCSFTSICAVSIDIRPHRCLLTPPPTPSLFVNTLQSTKINVDIIGMEMIIIVSHCCYRSLIKWNERRRGEKTKFEWAVLLCWASCVQHFFYHNFYFALTLTLNGGEIHAGNSTTGSYESESECVLVSFSFI